MPEAKQFLRGSLNSALGLRQLAGGLGAGSLQLLAEFALLRQRSLEPLTEPLCLLLCRGRSRLFKAAKIVQLQQKSLELGVGRLRRRPGNGQLISRLSGNQDQELRRLGGASLLTGTLQLALRCCQLPGKPLNLRLSKLRACALRRQLRLERRCASQSAFEGLAEVNDVELQGLRPPAAGLQRTRLGLQLLGLTPRSQQLLPRAVKLLGGSCYPGLRHDELSGGLLCRCLCGGFGPRKSLALFFCGHELLRDLFSLNTAQFQLIPRGVQVAAEGLQFVGETSRLLLSCHGPLLQSD
mmetsp:Transcript_26459/g.58164  ORF Transcript_26459/g.58164 Transcript_26459/m.58164 type:complete len:296 (-) Transcript_26459:133-1020(-)